MLRNYRAFSSFPDAPQTQEGSQIHSFRIRLVTDPIEDKAQRSDPDRPRSDDGFVYGFSYFTQRKDPSSKRGYQQVRLDCNNGS